MLHICKGDKRDGAIYSYNTYLKLATGRHTEMKIFFREALAPPIVSPDTPIGEAAQPIEGQSTWTSSMPLDRGRATDASLQTEARKKPVPPIEITEAYGPPVILVR